MRRTVGTKAEENDRSSPHMFFTTHKKELARREFEEMGSRVSVWLMLIVALLLSVCGTCRAQFAIPERYDGFVYDGAGKGKGPIIWEAFIDPLCIDCKVAWPVVKQVSRLYGKSVMTIVHPFPVP